MTGHNQLQRSGIRLQRQGSLWLDQTWQAGETFVAESRDAAWTFARDVTEAGRKLTKTLGQATQGLQRAVHKEALDWKALVLKTRDAYIAAGKAQLVRFEQQASSTREALNPETVETTVLQGARDLLGRAQQKVDQRLEQGVAPARKRPASAGSARSKARKPRAKASAAKAEAPIRDYDRLTAKDLAARVQKLPSPQVAALLDYERARKKRATVIRAAEQRLAAAS
jgi:hypothetical protein